ncbi:MAG TPA: magnesium/cobalt transporter CorA [Actinomycetes bacterium]|nr:magnesium/cobalt transporter CorA [Actinomycetes bacterium]
MIQVHVFREGQELTEVPVADLSEVRKEPGTLVWADVVSATPDELADMGREFDIHPVALEDCQPHRKQRPKVEEYPGHVLLVAYAAKHGSHGRVELHELDLVAGQNFLVSFHAGRPINAESVARRIKAHPELASEGAGFLLYVILDELVDTFFPALDTIGGRVEDLEEAVFAGSGDVQTQIFTLRKDLIALRRVAGPMRDSMVLLLRRDLGLFSREAQRYLQDIYDHLIRVVESVEDYQDLAAGALEANLTVASNRVNTVARNLAGYAAIFAVITMISGIYGMNFDHMPELHWRFGYAWALGLMAFGAGGLWLYFKRKDWL